MIGILMSSMAFNREAKYFNNKESIFNQYKPLANKYQVDLCMFSYKRIKHQNVVDALVYSCKQDKLVRKSVALPRVNIVRNTRYIVSQELISKLEKLNNQDFHFINLPLLLQLNKMQNHEYLKSHKILRDHLPPTKILSFEHLDSFTRLYGKVIIKPIYGSKGRRITIIEKNQANYLVCQTPSKKYDYTNSGLTKKETFVPHSQIKQFYNETFRNPKSFLVQQWIEFRELNGRPYDIRAVVQKNGKNKWQLTSRVARVANKKGQITNLNQGGEKVSLSELKINKYHRDIRKFCLEIAKSLEKHYSWTAEMGIDLSIDNSNKLWYIETNFCPEKMKWSTIYKIPFEYAYYKYTRL